MCGFTRFLKCQNLGNRIHKLPCMITDIQDGSLGPKFQFCRRELVEIEVRWFACHSVSAGHPVAGVAPFGTLSGDHWEAPCKLPCKCPSLGGRLASLFSKCSQATLHSMMRTRLGSIRRCTKNLILNPYRKFQEIRNELGFFMTLFSGAPC